jgi:tryptophan synthase alpha chain
MTLAHIFRSGRPAFMPYFTLGYPDYESSLDIIQACAEAGADLMELGIPFSDPLADGPTIQHSTHVALQKGMTVARSLQAVRTLRARGLKLPLLLMGYLNPALAYGLADFVADAAGAGADGFIIPDLPPEEADELQALCRAQEMNLIFLLAPNSPDERVKRVAQTSSGFIYLVSVTGVTGARSALPPHLPRFVQRVRAVTDKPLAVGFGIATPQQAAAVGKLADGVIVGSALIKVVQQADDPVAAAAEFVHKIKAAL